VHRREEFVDRVFGWVDVPWRKVGSTREGTNCLGLPVGVAREMGGFNELVSLGEKMAMFDYPLTPRMMVDGMMGHMTCLKPEDAIPGDLLLFRVSGRPDHVVVVTALTPLRFVHSQMERERKVRPSTLPMGWIPVGAFRIEDLDE